MSRPTVYTIGYSNHEPSYLLELLAQHAIEVVVDVRSSPHSRRRWYCREELRELLTSVGLRYGYMGDQLGARRDEPECYVEGVATYQRVAELPNFKAGVERIKEGCKDYRIALMCGERDPLDCHRGVLIAPSCVRQGIDVQHILADGTLEDQSAMEKRMVALVGVDPLFDTDSNTAELTARAYAERGRQLAYHIVD